MSEYQRALEDVEKTGQIIDFGILNQEKFLIIRADKFEKLKSKMTKQKTEEKK